MFHHGRISLCQPKAVYSLDLVALMAGGRFQNTANLFIERMERHAELESNAESTTATVQSDRCPARTTQGKTVITVDAKKATSSAPRGELHPVEPPFKKAKSGASFGAGQEPGRGGGVRRVRLPPLDVFQREYMETATPVILTGVSRGQNASLRMYPGVCVLSRVFFGFGCIAYACFLKHKCFNVFIIFFSGCGHDFRQGLQVAGARFQLQKYTVELDPMSRTQGLQMAMVTLQSTPYKVLDK